MSYQVLKRCNLGVKVLYSVKLDEIRRHCTPRALELKPRRVGAKSIDYSQDSSIYYTLIASFD